MTLSSPGAAGLGFRLVAIVLVLAAGIAAALPVPVPMAIVMAPALSARSTACVIRLGHVYSATGPLASFEASAAYATAVAKINIGDYASGKRKPGIALGKGLATCLLELVEADDQSNITLHDSLVAAMIPQVDFFLIGNDYQDFSVSTAQQVVAANMLSVSCCLTSESVFTLEPNQRYLFGMSREQDNSPQLLLHYLNLSPVVPTLAIVYSISEPTNVQACTMLFSQLGNLKVVLNFTMTTGDGSLYRLPQLLVKTRATFVFACLAISDSLLLAPLLNELHPDGVFYLNGATYAEFAALPSALYSFTGEQWAPELPYSDDLFGNSSMFIRDMRTYGLYTAALTDVSCLAAVSVEILVKGIVAGSSGFTSTDVNKVLAASQASSAAAMQAFTGNTLLGLIEFDALHRNEGGTNVMTQFLPPRALSDVNASVLALVFPYDYSSRLAIYPAPQAVCQVILGLVYSATGPLANSDAYQGYQIAIDRINLGLWEGSGYIDAGFDLGSQLKNCSYAISALDDESNSTLHATLVNSLLPRVQFMLSGAVETNASLLDQALLNSTLIISVMCCSVDLNVSSPSSGVFSLAKQSLDALSAFLLPLGVNIGIVYSVTEESQWKQCASLANYSNAGQALGQFITFSQQVQPGDINATTLLDALNGFNVHVLIACVDLPDAIALADAVKSQHLRALFLSNGPGNALFESSINASSAYALTSQQWLPSTYSDLLLGDLNTFAHDLVALDAMALPNAVNVAAAVSIEVLHRAVLDGMGLSTSSSVELGVAGRVYSIRRALITPLEPTLVSLFGPVAFDPNLHVNIAAPLVIAQMQSLAPDYNTYELVPVLPSDDGFSLIYPIPTSGSLLCTITLGLVYSASGPLMQTGAFSGFSLAVKKINAGSWASGSMVGSSAGFSLGRSLSQCQYVLVTRDDQSSFQLHTELVAQLATEVDFLLSGERGNLSAAADVTCANANGVFTLVTALPNLLGSAQVQPTALVFGFANPVNNAANELLRYLSFTSPLPTLAFVYTTSWAGATSACTSGIAAATLYGLSVVVTHAMASYDGSLPAFVIGSNSTLLSRATFIIACLEAGDAATLISLTANSGFAGIYTLVGLDAPAYSVIVPLSSRSYLFESTQWRPTLPFTDVLFGDASQFQTDLMAFENTTGSPSGISAVAAVSVELLHRSIMASTATLLYSEPRLLLNAARDSIASTLRSTVWATLIGVVLFSTGGSTCNNVTSCPANQNMGEAVYTAQVATDGTTLNLLFPSAVASANAVYPAPSYAYCVKLLGTPTTINYKDPDVPPLIAAQCQAWEDAVGVAQSSTSGDSSLNNVTTELVCSTCAPLFSISGCYGLSAVRDVTVYPFIRHTTCGSNVSEVACLALLINQSAILTVPCDYTPWDSSAGIFAAVFLSLCFVVNAVFAAIVVWKRRAKALRFAQFPLVLAFIIGACMMCAFGLVFVGPATDVSCQLRTWLFNLSATVTICPLFLKAYRVWRIFENPKLKHLVISTVFLLKVLASVLFVELVWLAIWTGVSPTLATCVPVYFTQLLTPIPSYVCANTLSWFAAVAAAQIGLYVIATLSLAMMTLGVSTLFAEKEVLFASANIAIVGGIVAFLFFFTNLSMPATTALVAVGIGWCSTFSVGVLIGPKLYWIFIKGESWTDATAFNKETISDMDGVHRLRDMQAHLSDDKAHLHIEVAALKNKINEYAPGTYSTQDLLAFNEVCASMSSKHSGGHSKSAQTSSGGRLFAPLNSSRESALAGV